MTAANSGGKLETESVSTRAGHPGRHERRQLADGLSGHASFPPMSRRQGFDLGRAGILLQQRLPSLFLAHSHSALPHGTHYVSGFRYLDHWQSKSSDSSLVVIVPWAALCCMHLLTFRPAGRAPVHPPSSRVLSTNLLPGTTYTTWTPCLASLSLAKLKADPWVP